MNNQRRSHDLALSATLCSLEDLLIPALIQFYFHRSSWIGQTNTRLFMPQL